VKVGPVVWGRGVTPLIQMLEIPANEARLAAGKEGVAQIWEAKAVLEAVEARRAADLAAAAQPAETPH